MAIIGSVFGGLDSLPPHSENSDHLCYLLKQNRYVTLLFKNRDSASNGTPIAVTLDQVEAKKLAERLLRVVERPLDQSTDVFLLDGVEGLSLGGPLNQDQCSELIKRSANQGNGAANG
jgi:hypothetical protein